MGNDLDTLGEDAQALVTGTTAVAGQKVGEARKHITAALDSGKEIYDRVCEQAVEGAKVADQTIRKNPYQAVGIVLGIGTLLGYLLSRRGSRNGD